MSVQICLNFYVYFMVQTRRKTSLNSIRNKLSSLVSFNKFVDWLISAVLNTGLTTYKKLKFIMPKKLQRFIFNKAVYNTLFYLSCEISKQSHVINH